VAIALIAWFDETTTGPVNNLEDDVGVEPSVV
jgi:hypothetical protein